MSNPAIQTRGRHQKNKSYTIIGVKFNSDMSKD